MATLAKPTSRVLLRCKPGSRADKATIAFFIFVLSGAAHAVVAWRTAEGYETRDIAFYVANFAAAAAEVSVSRAFWGSHRAPALQRGRCLQEHCILTCLRQPKGISHNNPLCRRCSKRHKVTQISGLMEAGGQAEQGRIILMLGNTWTMEY
ncbi:conserved hypothetical protein, partial [Verticillium alfalfae VaMs.102]